jgi:MOSC domain-containing protein YiiM
VGARVGTLVSVNVGLPRDVAWQGRTVHTGVWKHPVEGRRRVRRDNLDGDGQGDLAGHGGEQRAVLAYQLDSYRHWSAELGRDDLVPGNFGENLTVDGLPDAEATSAPARTTGATTRRAGPPGTRWRPSAYRPTRTRTCAGLNHSSPTWPPP